MRNRLAILPLLMMLTIVGIAAFQTYWLRKAYEREHHTTEVRLNAAFRETVFEEHAKKLRLDQLDTDSLPPAAVALLPALRKGATPRDIRNLMMVERLAANAAPGDSRQERRVIMYRSAPSDSDVVTINPLPRKRDRVAQLLADIEQPGDTLRIAELTAALKKRLDTQQLAVPFVIERLPAAVRTGRGGNKLTIGFRTPITFAVKMTSARPFLLRRIALPIALSFFLVAFTALSFWVLYRSLQQQRRLAAIKSDFISNITHELKTPIATVSVAIEALRNSMRLQFEKAGAEVQVNQSGDTGLHADRLHLLSVVYNLLDNALKYSVGKPFIEVQVSGEANKVTLMVRDKGIGIPTEYQDKVFDKFFRVPTGNVHNTKGYGLGLSYLAHVVRRHGGTVAVASPPGGGTAFTVTLPKQPA